MTRSHRSFHRLVWPILVVLVGLGFAMALYLRPLPSAATSAVAEEPQR